jgi:hypothetical protein
MRYLTGILLTGFFLAASPAMAADFDGSKPLLCALMTTFECTATDGCVRGTAADINAPNFIRIDFDKKLVTADRDAERTTEILSRTHVDGRTLLQGVQRGIGWSLAIDAENGTMTLTGAMPEAGFVVTGACTPMSADGRSFK